ncbi:MAG: PD-(D/E)XK nuclease family protein [Chloroflexi bacterium]|nr:PD-(D/E)XK nuclease family protein [Chloroflexota bacterium]
MTLDAPQARERPYVWVTWLPRLLSGNNRCEWASWFKAQHEGSSWARSPSTFDHTRWALDHTALLRSEQKRLEADGEAVKTERQNQFRLRGWHATLSGMPDLVSLHDGNVVIHDVKSGEPHAYHAIQVMLYMWAFPLARREYAGLPVAGRVVYGDHAIDVPASAVDQTFIDRAAGLIKRLADTEQPPPRTPSASECAFCEITAADCPDRVEEDVTEGETELF